MTSAVLHFLRVARVAVCLAATFTVALGSDPDPAEQAYQEGAAAMRAREYERAIEALGRAATLRPDHAKTWLGLGMAHSAQQDWEAAVEAYTHMVEADPSNPIAHNNLGNAPSTAGPCAR
jgi:Flp pilus assembly protein TadD